jgi:hypothetical protein
MTVGRLQGTALHDRILELAATGIDFDLTSAETGELSAHVAECPTCARRAAALRADAARLGRTPSVLPSSRVDDAVYAAIARQHQRPTRLTLLVAAGLLLIALPGAIAAGGALLRTWQTLPISVVPVPSTTPAIDVSPQPDASPVTVGETWGTIAIPASDIGNDWIGLMQAVTVTESRYAAVGRPACFPPDEPTTCHASAWTAGPGTGWTRAPAQPGLVVGTDFPPSGPEPGMLDVAAGPGGFVAIGYDSNPEAGGPAIWRSPDGRTWERIGFPFGSSPAEAYAYRVVAVGASQDRYVIVGYHIAGFSTPAPAITAHAAAWTSPDGITWTRSVDNAAVDVGPCQDTGEEPDCGGMRAVVATATGFVAVGQARTNGGNASRPAAWTSPDGLTWTRSDAGLDFDGRLSGVATGGPGLVAVGTVCRPDCAAGVEEGIAVISTDGGTWELEGATGAAPFESVASAAGMTFALGVRNQYDDPGADLQLWRRTDGVRWERVTSLPSIPDVTLYPFADIAATADRVVIVGWAHTSGDATFRNFSYTSPPVSAQAEPSPTPSSSPSSGPSLFQIKPPVASAPAQAGATGLAWTLAHTDANAYGTAIAHGPAGWLHVLTRDGQDVGTPRVMLSADLAGWTDVTPDEVRVGCVSMTASRSMYLSYCGGLWRSSDGRTWANVEAPPVADGTLKGDARAFYSDGTSFLATTGAYPSSDGIWVSSDGSTWLKIRLPDAPRVIIDAVAGRSSGGYVIAGRAADTEAELDASGGLPVWYTHPGRQALWESDDGTAWRSIPLGDVFRDARITGLAADGPGGGILAVGHIGEVEAQGGSPAMAMWRSEDSVTWIQLMGPAFDIREANLGDARVVALSDRWLVLASRPPGGTADPTAIGVVAGSEDGTTWWSSDPIHGPGPPSSSIQGLTTAAGRLVVLDNVDTGSRVWISP